MKNTQQLLLAFLLALSLSGSSGCALPAAAPTVTLVTRAVTIIGRAAGEWIVMETIESAMTTLFERIFSDTAAATAGAYQHGIIPLGNTGRGMFKDTPTFAVQGSFYGTPFNNTIQINRNLIVFTRNPHGGWDLTPESSALIKERTEVATAQQTLKLYGCDPGRIDGIIGKRTERAVECFQQKANLAVDGQLSHFTRQALLVQVQ